MRNKWVGATLVAQGEAEASPTRCSSCAIIYVAMYGIWNLGIGILAKAGMLERFLYPFHLKSDGMESGGLLSRANGLAGIDG